MPDFYTDKLRELRGSGASDINNLKGMADTSIGLANSQANIIKGTPDDASTLGGMFEKRYGTGMSGGWQGVLQSALAGASNQKKKSELEKIGNTLQQLQDYSDNVARHADEAIRNKQMSAEIIPLLKTYKTNLPNLKPGEGEDYLRGVVDVLNRKFNTNYEYYSSDVKDPNKIVVIDKNTGEGLPTNLLDIPELAEVQKSQMVSDLEKRAEITAQQRLANETTSANAYANQAAAAMQNANTASTYKPQLIEQGQQRLGLSQQNANMHEAKTMEPIKNKIEAKQEFLRDAPKIMQIVDKYPKLWGSLAALQWSNQDPGYWATKLRNNNFDSIEESDAAAMMVKYINKMALDTAKGFSRPNMFIEKIGSKAVPNFNMTSGAFKKILSEKIDQDTHDVETQLKVLKNYGAEGLADIYDQNPQQNQQENINRPTDNPQQNVNRNDGVWMIAPNGKRGFVATDKIKNAMSKGLKIE